MRMLAIFADCICTAASNAQKAEPERVESFVKENLMPRLLSTSLVFIQVVEMHGTICHSTIYASYIFILHEIHEPDARQYTPFCSLPLSKYTAVCELKYDVAYSVLKLNQKENAFL